MNKKRDSVAKGGGAVGLARIIGMIFSFLLFILLSRQSPEHAGTFKTVLTYIIIAESLTMLGLHRWLAAEISTLKVNRWPVFWATNVFTFFISLILMAVYWGIAKSSIYAPPIQDGLMLGILAVIPSGVSACVMSALMGMGQNQFLGKLSLIENVVRSSIAIILVYFESSVNDIIAVYVIVRWLVALYGFFKLKDVLLGHTWRIERAVTLDIKNAAPKFLLIIAAFLLLRNAGLLIVPGLTSLIETTTFAIAYQLFDLMLIIPTVLAITSINLFSSKAAASKASLNRASSQLLFIMAISSFPLIAIICTLASQLITLLYGSQYAGNANVFVVFVLASAFMMLDMVLSQIMQARKDYHNDMVSVTVAGASAGLLTYFFTINQGALGASLALLVAISINIAMRLYLLKEVFRLPLLYLSIWKPTLASLAIYFIIKYLLNFPILDGIRTSNILWLLCIPVELILYGVFIYALGCLKHSHRSRIKHFLFQH